ncbi:hypothetical protein VH570_19460 [Sphingobium sp. HT1-2]|uniref:hypothetical protein n=1 Tax=Sphingobium sp. HT1-2 TaxID=3111640 RepID=UPI003C0D698A
MSEPVKIVIVLEGGVVQSVMTAGIPVSCAIIDYDTDGNSDVFDVPQGNGDEVEGFAEAAGHLEDADASDPARALMLYDAVVVHENRPCATCAASIETRLLPCDECGYVDEADTPSANEAIATPSAQIVAPAEMPAGVTFNEANLETGMCLWEAMLEIRDRHDVAARFNDVGTVAMRHAVMPLIGDCEREWEELGDKQDQHAPYDWEWCPAFLERNLSRLGVEPGEG